MSNGGIGTGSASIVLVFAVLCLTVFSLITLVVAGNDKALVDAEADLVVGYYEADTLAALILSDILASGVMPDELRGVEIDTEWDEELSADVTSYRCPVSDGKALYVSLVFIEDSCNILSWKMIDTGEWVADDSLNVWAGSE